MRFLNCVASDDDFKYFRSSEMFSEEELWRPELKRLLYLYASVYITFTSFMVLCL